MKHRPKHPTMLLGIILKVEFDIAYKSALDLQDEPVDSKAAADEMPLDLRSGHQYHAGAFELHNEHPIVTND